MQIFCKDELSWTEKLTSAYAIEVVFIAWKHYFFLVDTTGNKRSDNHLDLKEEAHEKNWDNRIPGKNGYLKKVLIFFTCDDNLSIDFAKLINKLITWKQRQKQFVSNCFDFASKR